MMKKQALRLGGNHALMGLVIGAFAAGCASNSVKKVDYSADTNTTEQIQRLDAEMQTAVSHDADVLAPTEYQEASEHLQTAKRQQAKKASLEKILDNVGYAQSYLDKAEAIAAERREKVTGIADARDAALKAGARDTAQSAKELKRLDNQFRKNVEKLGRNDADLDTANELQQGYMSLELVALQHSKLQDARDLITRARDHGAEKRAPNALSQAERSLISAENAIAANRHDEQAMAPAVTKAQTDAQLVLDVTDTSNTHGKIPESVALEMVRQQQANQNLNSQLANTQQQLNQSQSRLLATDADRAALEQDRKLNEALEKARQEFSSDEAEAYRQGDKLLIRLKKVQFASGRSDLPAGSLDLLSKVKDVASGLNSQQVTVEGHTDSTGSKAVNKKLSQSRAEAVAKYFQTEKVSSDVEAVGYGSEKPLTNNKTKENRATNRRVDVIITPGAAATM